jgi:ferredoxin/flavodoxin---NADP+ reductase
MYKILSNEMIVPNVHSVTIAAPAVAKGAKPGQFAILRTEEDGERIPLSLSDWDPDKGTITLIVMNIGATTGTLAAIPAGESIPTVVGPLGNPTELDRFGTVVCLCGCYGIGSIYPIAKALKVMNNRVVTVIEARSSFLLFWEDRLQSVCDDVVIITRDGSKGFRGHATRLPDVIESIGAPVDRVIINGCTLLMKRGSDATRPLGIKTFVNLNPIMIDGTGMCGVCRVTVGGKTKFACVDGPDFDGHEVDWDELFQRRKAYVSEERVPLRTSVGEKCPNRTAR